ncbi:hypothetical protein [Streptomyces sp. SID5473]|nr:hypothetical protein [Streptomyces sp. SID5473]
MRHADRTTTAPGRPLRPGRQEPVLRVVVHTLVAALVAGLLSAG